MTKEAELEASVEKQLRDAGVTYVKEHVVGDTRPDFLVTTDRGDQIVVEVKAWESNRENTARAIRLLKRYKELSKAEAAVIVTPTAETVSLAWGRVVSVDTFPTVLAALAATLAKKRRSRRIIKVWASPRKKVFASMPFSGRYDDTFLVAIQPSALALKALADRVDHTGSSGDVVQQIKAMIKAAQVIVADLSESRANVCHEVGYAEALGKTVIQICSTPFAALPFNLRNNQTIPYQIGQASKLKTKLEKELAKAL
jgi:Restriction endonuclease